MSPQLDDVVGARRFTRSGRITPLEGTCKRSPLKNKRILFFGSRIRPIQQRLPLQVKALTLLMLACSMKTFARASEPPPCGPHIPITPLLTGFFSGAWGCTGTERWEVRLGTALSGQEFITPYIRTSVGVSLPAPQNPQTIEFLSGWEFSQSVQYSFVPEDSFKPPMEWSEGSLLYAPSLQQWNLLLDSEIAMEVSKKNTAPDTTRRSWGVKFWQVLPPQWRTLGALRSTRNANAYGLTVRATFRMGSWQAQLGLGRMTVAVDRIVASFFHPTMEVSFRPGEAK